MYSSLIDYQSLLKDCNRTAPCTVDFSVSELYAQIILQSLSALVETGNLHGMG